MTCRIYFENFLTKAFKKFSSTRTVERMQLAVCMPCQYDCISCSHGAIRHKFSSYQLPLDHLREFIHFTETSRYLIKKIHLTGPGEPLLWRHLKEGTRLLRRSPAFEKIYIISNGLNMHHVDDETWENIDFVNVSLYPAFKKWGRLDTVLQSHKDKIRITPTGRFRAIPQKGETAPIPCECDCTGPMYFDRKIFFYCGPTVFGAAESKGVDVYDYTEMYSEIGLNYLERSEAPSLHRTSRFSIGLVDPLRKRANHELCRYCFANKNFKLPIHDHVAFQLKPPEQ